ncbi:MAG: serine/threonine-protein kinase [Chloroflexota bacterium]|nr:MAG: serine/threonine-protein kinase [Chloroflexota bacterium]
MSGSDDIQYSFLVPHVKEIATVDQVLEPGSKKEDRYVIQQRVGGGGFATVYLARDIRLGNQPVAIKEFDPANLSAADRQWASERFEQEAMILAQLNHPGIAAVSDYFHSDGRSYLVTEYIEGEDLDAAWQRTPGNRFSEQQVLIWTEQLCDVLDYLHNQNPPVIFRDLKPSNIIVQPDGRLKLIDFGIARHFKSSQTKDTQALGTPGYAAPEQYALEQADARSDIYALGAVLHQLLTGHDPASSPFNFPPVRQLAPSVSAHVAAAVEQALQMDRELRFASAGAFYRALQGTADTLFWPQVQATETQPLWRKWIWPALIIAILLLAAGGLTLAGVFDRGETTPTPESGLSGIPAPMATNSSQPEQIDEEVDQPGAIAPPTTTPSPTPSETPSATPTATPSPTFTPEPAPQIVFQSNRDGDFELYAMDMSGGSDVTQLTANDADDQLPAVSSDGRQMVFESNRDGNWEIYIMNRDGSNLRRLTHHPEEDHLPSWSPDGRQVVFVSNRDGDYDIYIISADGSGLRQVTDTDLREGHVSWSVNDQLVYNSGTVKGSTWEIYTSDISGGNHQQLTDNGHSDWSPEWSPDGRSILYLSIVGNEDPALFVMDADGSNQRLIYNSPNYDWGARWSAVGDQIIFTQEIDDFSHIYIMNADGSGATRLTTRGSYPAWAR